MAEVLSPLSMWPPRVVVGGTITTPASPVAAVMVVAWVFAAAVVAVAMVAVATVAEAAVVATFCLASSASSVARRAILCYAASSVSTPHSLDRRKRVHRR